MPKSCLVDSGALVALLNPRERHHAWARETFSRQAGPWLTCEAVLTETYFLVEPPHEAALDRLLLEGVVQLAFDLVQELPQVLALRVKYSNVPMSLADACLVRMTEKLSDPLILTTDSDFRIYRRHSRQIVPCLMP